MTIITPAQLIILHELAKAVLPTLKFNSEKGCFEQSSPINLTFELSHFRDLEQTEKLLQNVLENVSPMGAKNTEAKDLPIQPGNDPGTQSLGRGT